jgi:hypothetical protein
MTYNGIFFGFHIWRYIYVYLLLIDDSYDHSVKMLSNFPTAYSLFLNF